MLYWYSCKCWNVQRTLHYLKLLKWHPRRHAVRGKSATRGDESFLYLLSKVNSSAIATLPCRRWPVPTNAACHCPSPTRFLAGKIHLYRRPSLTHFLADNNACTVALLLLQDLLFFWFSHTRYISMYWTTELMKVPQDSVSIVQYTANIVQSRTLLNLLGTV